MIPLLSDAIFPDLNGIWEGRLTFKSSLEQSGLDVKARIRQNLWLLHIDLYSPTSESHTLVAYPTIESGNKLIYYVYHNIPKNPEYNEYKGTSVLKVKSGSASIQLTGQYYTVRGTRGEVILNRLSDDPKEHIEI